MAQILYCTLLLKYSIKPYYLLGIADSLTCNSNGTVHQGELVMVFCELTYASSDLIDWRVTWQHSQRKLSGVIEDEPGLSSTYVAFPAALSDSGVYKCVMSHKKPDFSDSCETRLSVRCEYELQLINS